MKDCITKHFTIIRVVSKQLVSQVMYIMAQQQPQKTVSQILRTYGKQFRQIQKQYSDGHEGRCAAGVIMSYYGWDDNADTDRPARLVAVLDELERAGISKDQVVKLIGLNDSNMTFDQIAELLDRIGE